MMDRNPQENENLGIGQSSLKINGQHDESPKREELAECEEEVDTIDKSSGKEDSNEELMGKILSEALSEMELEYSVEFELLPEEEKNVNKEKEDENIEEEDEDIEQEEEGIEDSEEEEEDIEDIEEEDEDIEEFIQWFKMNVLRHAGP